MELASHPWSLSVKPRSYDRIQPFIINTLTSIYSKSARNHLEQADTI